MSSLTVILYLPRSPRHSIHVSSYAGTVSYSRVISLQRPIVLRLSDEYLAGGQFSTRSADWWVDLGNLLNLIHVCGDICLLQWNPRLEELGGEPGVLWLPPCDLGCCSFSSSIVETVGDLPMFSQHSTVSLLSYSYHRRILSCVQSLDMSFSIIFSSAEAAVYP